MSHHLYQADEDEFDTTTPQVDASTIHRFLLNKARLPCDPAFVIIDESSMMDVEIMSRILEDISDFDRCHVVFLGDIDQLAPVGPGAPFRDILASGIVPTFHLSINHRQGTNDAVEFSGCTYDCMYDIMIFNSLQ